MATTTIFVSKVKVDGTFYTPDQGKATWTVGRAWRTQSIFPSLSPGPNGAALDTAESDDKWKMVDTLGSVAIGTFYGTVEFGTTCIKSFTLKFTTDIDTTSDTITIVISINGTEYARRELKYSTTPLTLPEVATLLPAGQENSVTVDLTGYFGQPCGNVFKIDVTQYAAGTDPSGVSTYMEITDVT